ncbi:porin family protein [Endozoicomonas acroporae]|uniref:porin family protein n=1 Tax=Endozoicomonas acroporae TaxID=1701104 RepID=UPI003D799A9E
MKKTLIAAVALLSVSGSVIAAEGAYVGGNIGYATHDIKASGNSYDDNDTAWKLNAGYRFTDLLGVEVFYQDAGDASYKVDNDDVKSELSNYGAALTGTFDLTSDVYLTLKAGVAKWKADYKVTGGVSGTDKGTDLYLGLTAGYALNDELNVVANIDRIEGEEDAEITTYVYGLGVQYNF